MPQLPLTPKVISFEFSIDLEEVVFDGLLQLIKLAVTRKMMLKIIFFMIYIIYYLTQIVYCKNTTITSIIY